MKQIIAGCAAAVALAAFGGVAHATPLVDGGKVTPTASSLAGLTFVTSTTGTISPATFSATYTSSVYRTAGGTLDFVYNFSNSAGSANGIESFTAYNFGAFTTDASYTTGSGTVPVDASRNTSGSVVTFDFTGTGNGVAPGTSAAQLIIATNATSYDANGSMSLQDGSAGSGTGFEPTAVSAAPEPGAWALMLGGVGLLGLMLRGRLVRRRDDTTSFTAA